MAAYPHAAQEGSFRGKALTDYRRKIKTATELRAIIGTRPRRKSVCMCHGTFDIVHPGHIRHLTAAKERADILIASVTADRHVTKGTFRPHVTEQLRARSLAALEMVDYVVIDEEPVALQNIAFLQPDFFAKGFEYGAGHPSAKAEAEVVESYGGEMIFTPGDFVMSSSALIDASPPNLALETLLISMESQGLTFDDLRTALDGMRGLRVHVVGDTIVDTITETIPTGGMGKTPTLSVQVKGKTDYIGGAAIVAKHLAAAGAQVTFSTVLGDDANAIFVINDLGAAGIDVRHEIDRSRPTTNKNAIVAGGYRLLKLDALDNRPVPSRALAGFCEALAGIQADIVVFSDFRHGVFTRDSIPTLTASIPAGTFRVADSQVASRWGNILEFKGFDLITPNEREARHALGDQDSVIRPLASRLYQEAGCGALILKLGERGVLVQCGPVGSMDYLSTVGTFAGHIVDPVGAGDALLAYATLALRGSGSSFVAAVLGSVAASIECERDGNIPVSTEHVRERLGELERAANPHSAPNTGRSRTAASQASTPGSL